MSRSFIAVCATSLLLLAGSTEAQTTREVSYNPRSVVRINAKLRFTTMIILPEQEQILDFVCGDKEFWIVSGAQNLAYVKPAKAGASTNLNLVTASGNVYSFLLTEGTAEADLKLYVVSDGTMPGGGGRARGSSMPPPKSTSCAKRPTPRKRTRRPRAMARPRPSRNRSMPSRRRTPRASTSRTGSRPTRNRSS